MRVFQSKLYLRRCCALKDICCIANVCERRIKLIRICIHMNEPTNQPTNERMNDYAMRMRNLMFLFLVSILSNFVLGNPISNDNANCNIKQCSVIEIRTPRTQRWQFVYFQFSSSLSFVTVAKCDCRRYLVGWVHGMCWRARARINPFQMRSMDSKNLELYGNIISRLLRFFTLFVAVIFNLHSTAHLKFSTTQRVLISFKKKKNCNKVTCGKLYHFHDTFAFYAVQRTYTIMPKGTTIVELNNKLFFFFSCWM